MNATWRASASSATRDREVQGALTRCKVLAAMRTVCAPQSTQAIADAARISYDRARRALETLVVLKAVTASGKANNRRFVLADANDGKAA